MDKYSRPLFYKETAKLFLEMVLDIPQSNPDFEIYAKRIAQEESEPFGDKSTKSKKFRDSRWREDKDRLILHRRIFEEMLTKKRLENDDDVCLGAGGGLPVNSSVKTEKKAFYVMGLPASGKSSVCTDLCEQFGAFLLDNDLVKRKLPEYYQTRGASLVHDEASQLTTISKDGDKSIMEECMDQGYNLCIPKIGSTTLTVTNTMDVLRNRGYQTYVLLVSLERQKATQRAFRRYLKTNRYVPLGLIFDSYANDPIMSYYRLRLYLERQDTQFFDEMAAISSDVPKGQKYSIIDEQYAKGQLEQYLKNLKQ